MASERSGKIDAFWYNTRPLKSGWLAMLGVGIFWVLYQCAFGYSHGLDSMTPEFDSVWMGLWRFNIVGNAIFFAISIGWLWTTRDRNPANLDPKLELRRYFYFLSWLVCYIWGVYYAGSYTLEQDAAWHQVIIRDTSFTASHIVAFYGSFPLYITCGVSSYLYAQTRLPLYAQATSFPLVAAVVGPMFILPNVGLNEWGHAFWFVDELFSAPLHWGFVTLGWCGLFGAAGGVAAQIVSRINFYVALLCYRRSLEAPDPVAYCLRQSAKVGADGGCPDRSCLSHCQFICSRCVRISRGRHAGPVPIQLMELACHAEVDWCPNLRIEKVNA